MNKLLKTLSITTALIITGNIFLPFGIYAKTFEPVQNPKSVAIATNESDKQAQFGTQVNIETYKSQGLTDNEISYLQKVGLDKFTEEMDKFISYDRNGYATIKTAEAKSSKRSWNEISITQKMLDKYNSDLKQLDKNKDHTSNLITSIDRNPTTRDVKINFKTTKAGTNNSLRNFGGQMGPCNNPIQWINYNKTWWGYISFSIRLTDCATQGISLWYGLWGTIYVALAAIPPLTPIAGTAASIIGAAVAANEWMRYWCGYDGLVYKFKSNIVLLSYAVAYAQCD